MKRFCKVAGSLCLVILLLLSHTGCGGNQPAVQILDDQETQEEYLSFFSPNSFSGSDVGKYWSDHFAEIYQKKVYVEYDGSSYYAEEGLSYRELLEKRLQSTMPDDLYIINAEDVIDFERKGYWMDLSEMDFVQNLTDAALYQSAYNGKVFSVPLTLTGFGFYWNITLLEEYGLTVPENLEQFLTVCETLRANDILPYGANKGYALTVPAMCKGLAPLYQSADREQRIDALNNGAAAISSYLRDGYDFLQQLIDLGYMDPEQALSTLPGKEWDLFLSGGCAFICIGLGAVLEEPEKNNIRAELTGLPVLQEGRIAVYGADSRLCVNPNSKHLDTALEFIEMVGTKQALDISAMLDKTMSTAKDSALPIHTAERAMCELLLSPGQIPNQDFALHFNTWESIRNVAREICGGMNVDEACAMLDGLQRADLKAYKNN